MKKVLLLVLTIMLFSISVVYASDVDDINLSEYTTDDLITLKLLISQELLNRGAIRGLLVPPGIYEIGQNIPAGTYVVKPTSAGFGIKLYASEYTYNNSESLYEAYISSDEHIGKIELLEGNIIILNSSVKLFPYTGIDF